MAAIISWLVIILRYGPAVVALINELWKLWENVTDDEKRAAFKAEIQTTVGECKGGSCKVGSVAKLVDLRNRLKAAQGAGVSDK